MPLDDLSELISRDFRDIKIRARNLIKVFICGSHKEDDKQHIESLRDELRAEEEFKIPGAFLMEDLITDESLTLPQKFELLWKNITIGDNRPLCIVYAGLTSPTSQGLNAEIQNIARDNNKKQYTYLILHRGVKIVDHADEFVNFYVVDNVDEFKSIAKDIVRRKLREIETFLTFKSEGGGEDGKE